MADYQKPIGDREPLHSPLIIPPIQKDKHFKEKFAEEKNPKHKGLIFTLLVSCFKKILNLFSSKAKTRSSIIDQDQILKDLIAMRTMLQQLAGEDQSHDPKYTKQLGELWHNLVDDFNYVAQFEREIPEELEKIKVFIDKVSHYPQDEDHTLGFYFAEYAGKDWLPFPFLDILKNLHDEYTKTPQISSLREWIYLLNDAIRSLDIK